MLTWGRCHRFAGGCAQVMSYYRRFEIVADTMYKQRLIRGFCHLYDGQVSEAGAPSTRSEGVVQ